MGLSLPLAGCLQCKKAHGRKDRSRGKLYSTGTFVNGCVSSHGGGGGVDTDRFAHENFWGLPLKTLQVQLPCHGLHPCFGWAPLSSPSPLPQLVEWHVPTISFSLQTMYLRGVPFKTTSDNITTISFTSHSQDPHTCTFYRAEQVHLCLRGP